MINHLGCTYSALMCICQYLESDALLYFIHSQDNIIVTELHIRLDSSLLMSNPLYGRFPYCVVDVTKSVAQHLYG